MDLYIHYYNRGAQYYNDGQYSKSVEEFNRAETFGGKNLDIYSCRGVAYFSDGKFEEARKDFDEALKDPQGTLSVYCHRCVLNIFDEKLDEAVADFTKVSSLYEQDYAEEYLMVAIDKARTLIEGEKLSGREKTQNFEKNVKSFSEKLNENLNKR